MCLRMIVYQFVLNNIVWKRCLPCYDIQLTCFFVANVYSIFVFFSNSWNFSAMINVLYLHQTCFNLYLRVAHIRVPLMNNLPSELGHRWGHLFGWIAHMHMVLAITHPPLPTTTTRLPPHANFTLIQLTWSAYSHHLIFLMLQTFKRKRHCSGCGTAMDAPLSQSPLLWRHNAMALIVPRNTRGPERDAYQRPGNANSRRSRAVNPSIVRGRGRPAGTDRRPLTVPVMWWSL